METVAIRLLMAVKHLTTRKAARTTKCSVVYGLIKPVALPFTLEMMTELYLVKVSQEQ